MKVFLVSWSVQDRGRKIVFTGAANVKAHSEDEVRGAMDRILRAKHPGTRFSVYVDKPEPVGLEEIGGIVVGTPESWRTNPDGTPVLRP